jgi:hypothetical protein
MPGLAPVGGVPASTWRAARTCPRLLLVSEPNRSGKQISGRAQTADPGPDGCTARSVAGARGGGWPRGVHRLGAVGSWRLLVCPGLGPRHKAPRDSAHT